MFWNPLVISFPMGTVTSILKKMTEIIVFEVINSIFFTG